MIFKFQQGGNALPPLPSFNPIVVNTPTAETAAETTTKKGSDLTDKDLINMLDKLDGLPSDMAVLTNALLNFYIDLQYSPIPNTSNIASRYLSALQQLKTANFNRKEYDAAFDIVSKNGGLNEMAITDRGQLLCVNSDRDFKLLSISDLKNNKDYRPLTNSELLYYRALDPTLAYNNSLLKIVKNGTSMEKITNDISKIISGLGTYENVDTGYTNTSSKKLLNGLSDFIQASLKMTGDVDINLDNLYKYKVITKGQAELADLALSYIYRVLPENEKTLLKIKSGTLTDEGAKDLIGTLIASKLNQTRNFDLTLDTPNTRTSNKDSKTKGTTAFDLDPVSMLQAGYGEKETIHILTKEGVSNSLDIPTVRMPIVKKDGNSIGANSTLDDVSESAFAGYLDFENASMGGSMIPTSGFSNIAINGTALYTGYLPIDMDEYEFTGNIKPDLKMLGKYQQVLKKIAQENITDKNQINILYKEVGLPILYNANGDVVINYLKFGIINGTALSTAFPEETEFNDYLTETSDENEINNTVTALLKGRGDKDRINFDEKSFFDSIFGTDYTKVLKGTIFIPINQDYFTGTAGTGNYPNTAEAELIEANQEALLREKIAKNSYVNPGIL